MPRNLVARRRARKRKKKNQRKRRRLMPQPANQKLSLITADETKLMATKKVTNQR